ncbi:MAG TPA: TonB-dependent receptor plug domain-containing protein [Longimicrobiales bacterium]|nr:TonB-dependent receptor plug domain-containing protein [Longimicrobiales bacterium]
MSSHPLRRAAPGVLALTLVLGCSLNKSGNGAVAERDGQLITAEQIRLSGASTGWDVLRRFGEHLSITDHERGPVRVTRRGRESIYIPEAPMLLVDGVRVSSFRVLSQLPARDIESMRILTGSEGATRYGIHAASGVIIVETFYQDPTRAAADTTAAAVRVGQARQPQDRR